MVTKDRCVKGISCGLSCINANKECISEFPPEVRGYVQKMADKLTNAGYGSSENEAEDLEAARIFSAMKKPEYRLFQEQQQALQDPEFSSKKPEEQYKILTKMKEDSIKRFVDKTLEEKEEEIQGKEGRSLTDKEREKIEKNVRQGFSESYWDRSFKNKKFQKEFKASNEEEQQMIVEGLLLIGGQPRDKGRIVSSTPEEMLFLHNNATRLQEGLSKSTDNPGGVDPAIKGGIKDVRDEIIGEIIGKDFGKNVDFDKVTDMVYGSLPNNIKTNLKSAGSVKKDIQYGVRDGESGDIRAKAIIKEYLKQGGRDIYTGKVIPLFEADLEHLVPAEIGGSASEQPDNWAFTRSDINKGRGMKTFEEYVNNGPTKTLGLTPGKQASIEDIDAKTRSKIEEKAKKSAKDDVEKNRLLRSIGVNLQPGVDGLQDTSWLSDPEQVGKMKKLSETLANLDGSTKNGKLLVAIAKTQNKNLNETIKAEPFARGNRRFEWLKKIKIKDPNSNSSVPLADWLAKAYVRALERGDEAELKKIQEFMYEKPKGFKTGVKSGEISPGIREAFDQMDFKF